MNKQFKTGDKVWHSRKFLQSCGWYTDVPKFGIVKQVAENKLAGITYPSLLTVNWADPYGNYSKSAAPEKIFRCIFL